MKKEREDKDKKPEQLNLNEPPLIYQTQEPQEAIEEELEEVVLPEEAWERIRRDSREALRKFDEEYLNKYANQTFEEAWAEALTPEEFWEDIYQMINEWYAEK